MFDIQQYPYDSEHNALDIAGEAMVFHCHHYLNYLQRSILDADYIDSRPCHNRGHYNNGRPDNNDHSPDNNHNRTTDRDLLFR